MASFSLAAVIGQGMTIQFYAECFKNNASNDIEWHCFVVDECNLTINGVCEGICEVLSIKRDEYKIRMSYVPKYDVGEAFRVFLKTEMSLKAYISFGDSSKRPALCVEVFKKPASPSLPPPPTSTSTSTSIVLRELYKYMDLKFESMEAQIDSRLAQFSNEISKLDGKVQTVSDFIRKEQRKATQPLNRPIKASDGVMKRRRSYIDIHGDEEVAESLPVLHDPISPSANRLQLTVPLPSSRNNINPLKVGEEERA